MTSLRLIQLCAAVSCGALMFCSATYCGELTDQFYQDFRSPKFPPPAILEVAKGEGEQKFARRESGGVRVFVSGEPSGFPPFGISPRFHVSDDFEITASYELLILDKPLSGYGVSVSLWAITDTPSGEAATLARSHRPWDGSVWVADKGWWEITEKKYHHDEQAFPTLCNGGKLRLVRTGSVLHFLVAEGDGEEFQELRQVGFNQKDLIQIHLGVDTGGSNGPVEVLLKDLRIRAGKMPLGRENKRSWRWSIWPASAGLLCIVVLAVFVAVWRYRRKRVTISSPKEEHSRVSRDGVSGKPPLPQKK